MRAADPHATPLATGHVHRRRRPPAHVSSAHRPHHHTGRPSRTPWGTYTPPPTQPRDKMGGGLIEGGGPSCHTFGHRPRTSTKTPPRSRGGGRAGGGGGGGLCEGKRNKGSAREGREDGRGGERKGISQHKQTSPWLPWPSACASHRSISVRSTSGSGYSRSAAVPTPLQPRKANASVRTRSAQRTRCECGGRGGRAATQAKTK